MLDFQRFYYHTLTREKHKKQQQKSSLLIDESSLSSMGISITLGSLVCTYFSEFGVFQGQQEIALSTHPLVTNFKYYK